MAAASTSTSAGPVASSSWSSRGRATPRCRTWSSRRGGTRGRGDAHDEAIERKVERLGDCRLVYLTAIGGPSAARLARRGIMPVKVAEGSPIEEAAVKLMTTIRTSPPPWLRRALATNTNHEGEDR
jgi:hypothetical protein